MSRGRYEKSHQIIDVSPIYQHGKTHVPKDVREILGVKDGDKIVYWIDEGKIYIEKT